jgi:AhpD family alkylhydroperoxidase
MADFPVYDEVTAPEASRPHLEAAKRRMGFVTTLNGVMAESPELLAGYNTLAELFGESSLPKDAQHVVWLTASLENDCEYCVAAHSTLGLRAGLPPETVEALRRKGTAGRQVGGRAPADPGDHQPTGLGGRQRDRCVPRRRLRPPSGLGHHSGGGYEDVVELHQPHRPHSARPGLAGPGMEPRLRRSRGHRFSAMMSA